MVSQTELDQPWRQWYTELMSSVPAKDQTITMKDEVNETMNPAKYGMSQHGTIALDPRRDVDLFREKIKPMRRADAEVSVTKRKVQKVNINCIRRGLFEVPMP